MHDVDILRGAFEAIYREDRWSNGSGPGSSPANTIEYRAFLERFLKENAIRSVTDLGCGDWQFSRLVDWSAADYTGLDVVPALVETNAARYGRDGLRFGVFTSLDSLPGGDLLLAKEVLQHLPNAMVAEYLAIIRARYRFALLTNAVEPREQANRVITAGDWRPLRLDQPPFSARGAVVLTYFPQSGSHFWKNSTYLLFGDG